jgi:ribosomal protein L24
MNLRLTDAPLDGVAEVNVTIESINLVREDDDDDADDGDNDDGDEVEAGDDSIVPVFAPDQPVTINLLELTDSTTTLVSDAAIPAGEYSQMRLVLTNDNTLVFDDGTTADLKTPSAQQSGFKIQIPGFEIDEEGDVVDLTLDFDASQSVVDRGNAGYLLKPVVKAETIEFSDADLEAADVGATGRLENVNTSGPTVTVEGVTFTATDSTDYDGVDNIDGLSSFSYAAVEAVAEEDGTYRAVEIEAAEQGEFSYSLEGAFEDATDTSVTLLGQTIAINSDTDYEGTLDAATLQTLTSDSRIEVEFNVMSDGSRVATSIELETD